MDREPSCVFRANPLSALMAVRDSRVGRPVAKCVVLQCGASDQWLSLCSTKVPLPNRRLPPRMAGVNLAGLTWCTSGQCPRRLLGSSASPVQGMRNWRNGLPPGSIPESHCEDSSEVSASASPEKAGEGSPAFLFLARLRLNLEIVTDANGGRQLSLERRALLGLNQTIPV